MKRETGVYLMECNFMGKKFSILSQPESLSLFFPRRRSMQMSEMKTGHVLWSKPFKDQHPGNKRSPAVVLCVFCLDNRGTTGKKKE